MGLVCNSEDQEGRSPLTTQIINTNTNNAQVWERRNTLLAWLLGLGIIGTGASTHPSEHRADQP